jgi:hypothetical protein
VKVLLIVILVLALLAGVYFLILQRDDSSAVDIGETIQGPGFEVKLIRPFTARPALGLLSGSDQQFDHTSPGAKAAVVEPDHLELRAEGWNLLIASDGNEGIGSGTYLVFPTELGGRQVTLRCRPADSAEGYFRTANEANADELKGVFLVKLAKCENQTSGKSLDWPPAPLTLTGSFAGLPRGRG